MIRLVSYRYRAVIFACIALLPLLGCGEDDGIGQRYSVSGKVTYKGELLKGGNVAFLPDGAGELGPGSERRDQGRILLDDNIDIDTRRRRSAWQIQSRHQRELYGHVRGREAKRGYVSGKQVSRAHESK